MMWQRGGWTVLTALAVAAVTALLGTFASRVQRDFASMPVLEPATVTTEATPAGPGSVRSDAVASSMRQLATPTPPALRSALPTSSTPIVPRSAVAAPLSAPPPAASAAGTRATAESPLVNSRGPPANVVVPPANDCGVLLRGGATISTHGGLSRPPPAGLVANADGSWPDDKADRNRRLLDCPLDVPPKKRRWLAVPIAARPAARCASATAPLATVALLARPQHALHFLWSVLSVVALQHDAGVDYRSTPAELAVLSYGTVGYWAELADAKTYPHVALLRLLSNVSLGFFRRSWKHYYLVPPDVASTATHDDKGVGASPDEAATSRQLVSHESPFGVAYWRDVAAPVAPSSPAAKPAAAAVLLNGSVRCYGRALVGNVPVVIPPRGSDVRPRHAAEMRRRAIEAFRLPLWPPPPPPTMANSDAEPTGHSEGHGGYVLLVLRHRQRRILNADWVANQLRSAGLRVRNVTWEDVPTLPEMLALAVNAAAMVGVHGNGLAWTLFMPAGARVVELVPDRTSPDGGPAFPLHESPIGRNRPNPANLAELYGQQSLTVSTAFERNKASLAAKPSWKWKTVDLRVTPKAMAEAIAFLKEPRP